MSPRRLPLALGLASVSLVGLAAAFPWTVGTDAAARLIGRELAPYGLALSAAGPATLRLLPLPRIDVAHVRIDAASTTVAAAAPLAEDGRLTIVIDPLGLLTGRIGIGSLSLDRARIALTQDDRWSGPLQHLADQARAGQFVRPHRVVLTNATLVRPGEAEPEIDDLDLDLDWPAWGGSLDGSAAFTWRGQRARASLADLRPASLAGGSASDFAASLSWPGGSLSASGSARLGPVLTLEGTGKVETRSLPETLAWIGRDAPLAPLAETFAMEGSFSAEGSAVMLPRLRVRLGQNVLDGAGQASLATPRAALQATLAADSLNLAPLLAQLIRVLGLDGTDDPAPALALQPFTGGDLDLRLSSAAARLGPIALDDMAASLLVRDGAVEIALNRAGVQGGIVKGRATLTSAGQDGGETEVKAQGAIDRVDLGGLLIDLGASRWVLGPSQGHFSLDSSGRDLGELASRASGRALLAIDRGAIVGLDLADVIQRHGGVAAGALARRNGRTPFERASITLRVADGRAEIVEGALQAAALSARLRGSVSLRDRTFQARAELHSRSGSGGPGPLFDLTGPWDAVTVRAARPGEAEPEMPTGTAPASALQALPALLLPGSARAYAP